MIRRNKQFICIQIISIYPIKELLILLQLVNNDLWIYFSLIQKNVKGTFTIQLNEWNDKFRNFIIKLEATY